MENLPALNLKNLDKSQWKTYRFDEIAKNISERVDPNNTDLEVYVGLEHIDSESIHLKRTGTPDDVDGQKLRFYPGDVIFARRRAYQRKAAVATKHGFCSAHALVLRANPEVIDPRLFPFFMHSDAFMHRAVNISVGSLSPTINWGTLKHQSFSLPSTRDQNEMFNILTSLDHLVECDTYLYKKLSQYFDALIEKVLHGINLNGKTIRQGIELLESAGKVAKLSQLGVFFKGKGIPKSEVIESGIPSIRYGELYTTHHKHIREYQSFISESSAKDAFKIEKHDVLFASSGETIAEIGKSAAFVKDDLCYAGSDILVFRPNNMDGTYLGYLLNSNFVRQQLNKLGTGATVMHIYASDLSKIKIPVITRDMQEKIGKELEQIQSCIENLELKIESSRLMQKRLINQIF